METDKTDEQKFLEELEEVVYSYLSKETAASFKQLRQFIMTLNEESDRGAALVAAEVLSDALGSLIKSKLVSDKKLIQVAFSTAGAFGAFSARIDHAFLLGLLPEALRKDLHLLRRIRNEFAHSTDLKSFETHSIKSRCMELNYYGIGAKNSAPRIVFQRSMGLIFRMIVLKITETQHASVPPNPETKETEEFVRRLVDGIKQTDLDLSIVFKDADLF
jgi:DNA-binding MltR family transcriptional regulator